MRSRVVMRNRSNEPNWLQKAGVLVAYNQNPPPGRNSDPMESLNNLFSKMNAGSWESNINAGSWERPVMRIVQSRKGESKFYNIPNWLRNANKNRRMRTLLEDIQTITNGLNGLHINSKLKPKKQITTKQKITTKKNNNKNKRLCRNILPQKDPTK